MSTNAHFSEALSIFHRKREETARNAERSLKVTQDAELIERLLTDGGAATVAVLAATFEELFKIGSSTARQRVKRAVSALKERSAIAQEGGARGTYSIAKKRRSRRSVVQANSGDGSSNSGDGHT